MYLVGWRAKVGKVGFLRVPGNIPVRVLVCWVSIGHGGLCFWVILNVSVWVSVGFMNLHPLGLFWPSAVFQYWSPLCDLGSFRDTVLGDMSFLSHCPLPTSLSLPAPGVRGVWPFPNLSKS